MKRKHQMPAGVFPPGVKPEWTGRRWVWGQPWPESLNGRFTCGHQGTQWVRRTISLAKAHRSGCIQSAPRLSSSRHRLHVWPTILRKWSPESNLAWEEWLCLAAQSKWEATCAECARINPESTGQDSNVHGFKNYLIFQEIHSGSF